MATVFHARLAWCPTPHSTKLRNSSSSIGKLRVPVSPQRLPTGIRCPGPALSVRANTSEGEGWLNLSSWFGGRAKQQQQTTDSTPDEGPVAEWRVTALPEEKIPTPRPRVEVGAVVVGAGLAGLAAAKELQKRGVDYIILEASDDVGGRVRTDNVEGFLLDRGFQIFLSAYPEAEAVLNYPDLDLRNFYAGALVRLGDGSFHKVADPFRHPLDGVASLTNPVGSVVDKVLVGLLRLRAVVKSFPDILKAPETTIIEALESQGFSPSMIDRFFRPFLGGIFFDRQLKTTSRMLEFVIKVLALGPNTLPAQGIGAIPQQLANALPADRLKLNTPVLSISPASGEEASSAAEVTAADGSVFAASAGVIVAADQPAAEKLLGSFLESSPSPQGQPRSTVCLYFAAPSPPSQEPILYLNGSDTGVINNLCFPSTVAPRYAPEGQTLVSVSLVGEHMEQMDEDLERTVRRELKEWFPSANIDSWRHLKTYRIPYAQPDQTPPSNLGRKLSIGGKLFVCGDHRSNATFDGALRSGRLAAEELCKSGDVQGVSSQGVSAEPAAESVLA